MVLGFAARRFYPAGNSKVAKRVDDKSVWSIVCLFIKKEFRNAGVSVKLIKAAAEYVKKKGGRIVEGYPIEPTTEKFPGHVCVHRVGFRLFESWI